LADNLLARGRYVTDFTLPQSRLLLLDCAELERLCLYLGAIMRMPQIRSILDGNRVRAIIGALGEAVYDYALKRGPLLGEPPAVAVDWDPEDVHGWCAVPGAAYCAQLLKPLDQELLRRLILKLPETWSAVLAAVDPISTNDDGLPPLVRKVLKETLPEWFPLFA
jgi:hypothetical protein